MFFAWGSDERCEERVGSATRCLGGGGRLIEEEEDEEVVDALLDAVMEKVMVG